MVIHVLLNLYLDQAHGLSDHGQRPWLVKTLSSPWTSTLVSVHGFVLLNGTMVKGQLDSENMV